MTRTSQTCPWLTMWTKRTTEGTVTRKKTFLYFEITTLKALPSRGIRALFRPDTALTTYQSKTAKNVIPLSAMQNRANNVSQKHNGGHDGLSGYIVSSLKSVRHRYIIFVFMVCSVFTACSPGLVYLGP